MEHDESAQADYANERESREKLGLTYVSLTSFLISVYVFFFGDMRTLKTRSAERSGLEYLRADL